MEMIELRKDGSVSAQNGDFSTKELGGCMWSERERKLRKNGLVEWRAVNLHVGDVEARLDKSIRVYSLIQSQCAGHLQKDGW